MTLNGSSSRVCRRGLPSWLREGKELNRRKKFHNDEVDVTIYLTQVDGNIWKVFNFIHWEESSPPTSTRMPAMNGGRREREKKFLCVETSRMAWSAERVPDLNMDKERKSNFHGIIHDHSTPVENGNGIKIPKIHIKFEYKWKFMWSVRHRISKKDTKKRVNYDYKKQEPIGSW